MDKSTVFSKSGKGLLEIKSKSNRLSKEEFRLLNLVDGRANLQELVEKSRLAMPDLRKMLTALSDGGFIKELTGQSPNAGGSATSAGSAAAGVDDLDFTQLLGPSQQGRPEKASSTPPVAAKGRDDAVDRLARDEVEKRAVREKLEAEVRAKQEAERASREEAQK